MIGNGELSANIVVSSLAVAVPLPCSSCSDIAALAVLYVSKLWRSACERAEQAAVAELRDASVIDGGEAAALVERNSLVQEGRLRNCSRASDIGGDIVSSTNSLIEEFYSSDVA